MEIPHGDFFQVTIHSQKLLAHIQNLSCRIEQQQTQIDQLTSQAHDFEGKISEKINRNFNSMNLEWQKKNRKNCQDIHHLFMLFRDHDKKTQLKLNEHLELININAKRINAMKGSVEQDTCLKLSYFEKKIQNNVTVQELQKIMKEQMTKKQLEIQKIANNQESISFKVDKEFAKVNFYLQALQQKQKELEIQLKDKEQNPDQNMTMTGQKFPIRSNTKSSSSSKKKINNRLQRNGTIVEDRSDIQMFLGKIQELQAKIKQKGTKNMPTVVQTPRGKQLSKVILQKLSLISDQYTSKTEQIEGKLTKLTNKYEIVNEQISILNRKIDKYKSQQLQTNDLLKHLEEKKVNEKAIEQIKNNIKQITKQFQQTFQTKVNKQTHQQDILKLKEKFKYVLNLSDQKSDKSEVKKIIGLLQDKLKDIIIVLAQQKNFGKDSATKKIPFKCLSCDKQLEPTTHVEPHNIYGHRSVRSSANLHSTRPSTNIIRKRTRMANTNISGDI